MGAICKQLLAELGVTIGSYVVQIGQVTADIPDEMAYETRFTRAEENDLRCPLPEATEAMRSRIRQIMDEKDTLGGIFEVVALGVPPGLGSHTHWDRRLDSRLMGSIGSVHAIKGVEIGPAFMNASRTGAGVHDEIFVDEDGNLYRKSNNAGGFEGGITTGQPILVRAAMKPISTVLSPRQSVDLATGEPAETVYERSDFCAVPRAAVVGEAMMAITLADALLEKVGGDSLDEIRPRLVSLRKARLDDLPMENAPWRFEYGEE